MLFSTRLKLPFITAVTVLTLSTVPGVCQNPAPASSPEITVIMSNSDFTALIKSALDLYAQKKYDEALGLSLKAIAARPNDFRGHYAAGVTYLATWKMKSASEAFAKAASLNPNNSKLYYYKAVADRYRNASDEGTVAARKAVELEPSFAEAYYTLGELLAMGSKDRKGAIEAFRTAIKLKPDFFKAYDQLGMHLEGDKDLKGAEELYITALALDPQKMACRFDLGRLLVKQGRLTEARILWNERKFDEKNVFPAFITLLERAEKLKQAEDALAQKPNDTELLLNMGLMVMEGESWVVDGRQERAIAYFNKALAVNPRFVRAQYAICKAYVQIADTFKDKNKNVDEELAKLKKMDVKLAEEIVEYRKTYKGGLSTTGGSPFDQ
jgi:superkiller protein 3